jgi:Fe-Mn family superoxide dismutase
MDFGTAAARYVDAFFANVNWEAVNARLDRAQHMHAILAGAPG